MDPYHGVDKVCEKASSEASGRSQFQFPKDFKYKQYKSKAKNVSLVRDLMATLGETAIDLKSSPLKKHVFLKGCEKDCHTRFNGPKNNLDLLFSSLEDFVSMREDLLVYCDQRKPTQGIDFRIDFMSGMFFENPIVFQMLAQKMGMTPLRQFERTLQQFGNSSIVLKYPEMLQKVLRSLEFFRKKSLQFFDSVDKKILKESIETYKEYFQHRDYTVRKDDKVNCCRGRFTDNFNSLFYTPCRNKMCASHGFCADHIHPDERFENLIGPKQDELLTQNIPNFFNKLNNGMKHT